MNSPLLRRGAAAPRGPWIAALLVGAVLAWIVWTAISRFEDVEEAAPPSARSLPQPLPAAVEAPAAVVPATPTAQAEPLPNCAHQWLDVAGAGGSDRIERGCVSATRSKQNGSVRSLTVEPEGVSAWRLQVDLAGEGVMAVQLQRRGAGGGANEVYGCKEAACSGVSLEAPDAHGARRLVLAEVGLDAVPAKTRNAAAVEAAPARIKLAARLAVPSQRASLPCPDAGLRIVDGKGSVVDFCALGGAGFELDQGDRWHYGFRDLEGRELWVTLAPDRTVAEVRMGGARCVAPACGGVAMQVQGDASDPGAQRSFVFSGTALRAASSGPAAVMLDGRVTMPAQ